MGPGSNQPVVVRAARHRLGWSLLTRLRVRPAQEHQGRNMQNILALLGTWARFHAFPCLFWETQAFGTSSLELSGFFLHQLGFSRETNSVCVYLCVRRYLCVCMCICMYFCKCMCVSISTHLFSKCLYEMRFLKINWFMGLWKLRILRSVVSGRACG